jgi:acyl-coenzyme A synthetase/AMP-(fatty) acid ligase
VVVVPEPGCDVPAEELRQRLVAYLDQRHVAKFKWPERLMLVDELPKTGTGKNQKSVMRDWVVSKAEASKVRT